MIWPGCIATCKSLFYKKIFLDILDIDRLPSKPKLFTNTSKVLMKVGTLILFLSLWLNYSSQAYWMSTWVVEERMLKGQMIKMSPLHIRMNGDGIILIIAKICIMKWKSQTQPYPLAPVNSQTCKIRTQFTQIAKNSYEAKGCALYFYGLFKLSLSSISNWRDINERHTYSSELYAFVKCALCNVCSACRYYGEKVHFLLRILY